MSYSKGHRYSARQEGTQSLRRIGCIQDATNRPAGQVVRIGLGKDQTMRNRIQEYDPDGLTALDPAQTKVLTTAQERELLGDLAECKRILAEAMKSVPGGGHPSTWEACAHDGPAEARLGAVYRRYADLRSKLALANVRLVAHVAKRFRDRGIAYSDLLQDGFCGLLEAIDRFDLGHGTKLATYATWWIRQAMQRAVASGAYPVRLSPRHLRQLAQNQDELDGTVPHGGSSGEPVSTEMIRRIHAATRPTVSLDASLDSAGQFRLSQAMSDPEGDRTGEVETGEVIVRLLSQLPPREQQVLSLRFGLGGQPGLSLSQVGKVLDVSKERVRQLQERALAKLRDTADEGAILDLVAS